MTFGLVFVGLILGVLLAYFISKGNSKKIKRIVWGITLIVIIAPLFSWLASQIYALIEESGWAGIALFGILFPSIFLIGLITLLLGIFGKEKEFPKAGRKE